MMKKNIKWLKEAVGELNLVDTVFEADGVSYIDTAVSVMQVYDLIDQLDEPEKVVIPQFVAAWIEQASKFHSISLLLNYRNIVDYSHESTLWCFESGNDDNLHKLARAWMDDYEVEEEQKYYVLLGNQLHDDNWTYALTNLGSIEVIEKDVLPEWDRTKLTEQEIKNYDARFWPFAEPVE